MDMRKFETGEQFLKPGDLRDGPRQVQIASVRDGKFGPDAVFETGEILGLNATRRRVLMRAYGPWSDDWVGKEIELSFGQAEFKKELQNTIIVRPISPSLTAIELRAAEERAATADRAAMNDEIPF